MKYRSHLHEITNEDITKILELSSSMHWLEALSHISLDEDTSRQINSNIGIVYAMPWDQIHDVLDIGAEMGFMSSVLAKFANKVIAVEESPQKALFISRRAEQDNLPIYPVTTSLFNLPFAPATFDLITLNDISKYQCLTNKDELIKFLTILVSLLKPGGYLYLGTATKHILHIVAGNFKQLVKNDPGHHFIPRNYVNLFKQVGLNHIEVLGAYTSYWQQKALYPISPLKVRKEIRNQCDPAFSNFGRLKRLLTSNSILGKGVEEDLLIMGRKGDEPGSLFWPQFNTNGLNAQINTLGKCLVVGFEANSPTTIAEFPKQPSTKIRCQQVFQDLCHLEEFFSNRQYPCKMKWPKPIEKNTFQGQDYYRYEYIRGTRASVYLTNTFIALSKQLAMIDQIVNAYIEMCQFITSEFHSQSSSQSLNHWCEKINFLGNSIINDTQKNRIQLALDYFNSHTWSPWLIHGDFICNNIIISQDNRLFLYDWENMSANGLPAVDLVRFGYDMILETKTLPNDRAKALISHTFNALRRVGLSLGIHSQDWLNMETLYLAEHIMFQQSRLGSMKEFLSIYQSGEFMNQI